MAGRIPHWRSACSSTGMAKTIAGFFRTKAEGESATQALQQAGFSNQEISFMAANPRETGLPKVGPVLKDSGSESEAASDAFIGAAVGLAAGVIAVVLPGIGPLIAAGPLAGAIGGLTAGAAAGGIIGLLKDHGISEDEAEFYAEGVRRGGALVTVHGVDEEREKKARQIFDQAGAIDTEQLADEWRRTGWTGSSPKTLRAG